MGIQINGATDSITAIDGTIDVVSAIGNAGVVTATAFVGNITGNVTGNINHASNLELQVGGVTRGNFDSSGRLLIGTTTEGRVEADDLTIATSGSTGITLRSAAGNAGNIMFSDGTSGDDEMRGTIQYHHLFDELRFFTNAVKRLSILSDGKVLIGHDTNIFNYKLAVFGTDGGNSGIAASRFSNNTSPSSLILSKSRGTSIGSYTIVQNNDEVGMIDFRGADGSDNMSKVAEIKASIDGTPGSNDMPGRLTFHTTANGASTTTERLRITSAGDVAINRTSALNTAKFSLTKDADQQAIGVQLNQSSGITTSLAAYNSSGSNIFDLAHDTDSTPDLLFKLKHSNEGVPVEKVRFASSGNVGIGTDNPAERLVVQGNGISNLAYDHDGGGFTSNSGGALVLTGYYDYSGAKLGLMVDNAGQGRIMTKTNQSLLIGTNNSKVITINGSGQTGINTTPQGQLFSIKGATDIMHYPNSSIGNDRLQIGFNAPEGYIKSKNSSGSPASNLALYTTDTSGNTNKRMHLSYDGKIGINQASPRTSLDVSGYIYSNNGSQIQITGSPGAKGLQLAGADDGNNIIGTMGSSGENLLFRTASSERMRLLVGGPHLLLGGSASVNEITETSSSSGLVIGNTSMGNGGLAIINSTTGTGRIYFGDSVGGNAARNRGQINYYHNGDYMLFATAGTERLRINSDGYVTHQDGKKCAFNVSGTNMTRNNTSGYVCQFDDDSSSGHFDSGNNFNTSTYKFVAPVSGYYYFFTNIRLDSFSSGYIRTAILSTSYHAGTSYWTIPATGHVIDYYHDPTNILHISTSTVMYLPATHEAWVYQDPSSDSSYTCYLNESSFGGYFIG